MGRGESGSGQRVGGRGCPQVVVAVAARLHDRYGRIDERLPGCPEWGGRCVSRRRRGTDVVKFP
jgi:hypothetical protein